MLAADKLPPLREVITRYGLYSRKSLGQNFLLDLNLINRIVRTAGIIKNTNVIEIGPGPGGLTRALLKAGAKVVAVEVDTRCQAALIELRNAYPDRLTVIFEDALKIDASILAPEPRYIISNLPYNIATPLLLNWLQNITAFESLTLMFQSEVAKRLIAKPGSKTYGRLSVIVQWLCHVQHEFNIDKSAFTPRPKVISTLVTLKARPKPLLEKANRADLEQVTKTAFSQRRKMLRVSLKNLGLNPACVGIKPTLRAEDLSVAEFCSLARLLKSQRIK